MKYSICLGLLLFLSSFLAYSGPTARSAVVSHPYEQAALRYDVLQRAMGPGKEALVTVYSLKPDAAGLAFLGQMYSLAKSGSNVVLIVDKQRNKVPENYLLALKKAGAKVLYYNPRLLNLQEGTTFNHRMHDKNWVINGEVSIQTDANISSMYFAAEKNVPNEVPNLPISRSIVTEGIEYAQSVRDHIMSQVDSNITEEPTYKKVTEMDLAEANRQLEKLAFVPQQFVDKYSDWKNRFRELNISEIQYFHDLPGKKDMIHGPTPVLLSDFKNAQASIVFESAYMVFTPEMRAVLKDRAEHGVKISAFTSHEHGLDNPLIAAAWPESREFLRSIGATVYETDNVTPYADESTRPARIHAKGYIVDDKIAAMTTENADGRSQNINSETLTRFTNPDLVADYSADVQGTISRLGVRVVHNYKSNINYSRRNCGNPLKTFFLRASAKIIPGQL